MSFIECSIEIFSNRWDSGVEWRLIAICVRSMQYYGGLKNRDSVGNVSILSILLVVNRKLVGDISYLVGG